MIKCSKDQMNQLIHNYNMVKQSYLLKTGIFLILSIISFAEPQVPTTFGLITVTHTRAGDNSQFMKYLKRYAYMQCPIINEISIIWNNEKSMQQMGIFQDRANWKIPIYFYRTPYNAMYWRYNIPKQTKSQVFFSIDDDIIVDCQQLMKGFEVWRKNAIGNLAPMVTYGARFYQFTLDRGFVYGRRKQREYFNTGLNLAFVSRHFLQLYYADIWELNELKKHILKKNNCDDIALNWIVQYFYPELPTIVIEGNIENRSPAVAQSTSANHYVYRNQCLKDFTDIFGVNPLRYIRMKDMYPSRQRKLAPLMREVVLAKQKYLNKYILKKQPINDTQMERESPKNVKAQINVTNVRQQRMGYKPESNESIINVTNVRQQRMGYKPESNESVINVTNVRQQRMGYKPESNESIISAAKVEQLKQQYESKIQQLQNDQKRLAKQLEESRKQSQKDKLIVQLQRKVEYSQNHNKELVVRHYWRSYLEAILGLAILVLLWIVGRRANKKQNQAKMFKLQTIQIQKQSINFD